MNKEWIKQITDTNGFDVFSKLDVCISHGKGCKLYDTEGREYTDFLAGIAVSCLGYGDEDIAAVIYSQAKKLIHISNLFYNEEQAKLIQKLTEDTIFDRAFICNSGAEANEAAIKLARKYFYQKGQKRFKIITALNSFHGRTITTATATGQPKYSEPYKPLTPGFVYVPFNDIEALNTALNDGEVAAVMLETVQGEGGVIPATQDYLKEAEYLTKQAGALLIIDEVQTGAMRCGSFFSYDLYGITPDIVTLAKGLGAGFPVGVMLAQGETAKAFKKGDHGSTFGGNPLACACANAVIEKLNKKSFCAGVKQKGEYFIKALSALKKYSFVKEPRGKGLLVGLPLSENIDGKEIVIKMLEKGYIINCAGGNTLRFVPPLIISTEEIDSMIKELDSVFAEISKGD